MASLLIGQASSKILQSLDLWVYQSSEGEKGVAGSQCGLGWPVKVTCDFHLLLSSAPAFGVQPTIRVEAASWSGLSKRQCWGFRSGHCRSGRVKCCWYNSWLHSLTSGWLHWIFAGLPRMLKEVPKVLESSNNISLTEFSRTPGYIQNLGKERDFR